MRTTFNGVGPRYVGRHDPTARAGVCSHCGREATLESFDTREWFALARVPLVPLGRYHVLDQCSLCTRHQRFLAPIWEEMRAQARRASQTIVGQQPADARSAIEAHQRLASFQLDAEAAALERAIEEHFPRDADALCYLAQLAAGAGREAEALRDYELAHLAAPSNPLAREGLALFALRSGDAARSLELLGPVLDSQTLPGTLAARELATALVEQGSFEEAQRVHDALLVRFPLLESDKTFAREVARCSSALGAARTRLPARAHRRLKLALAGAAGVAALALLFWADSAAAAHVKLYVVASTYGNLRVEIPGAPALVFRKPGVHELELPEGEYRAHVSGALERDVGFSLRAHGWPRFLDERVHVLDATGGSILAFEESTYSSSKSQQHFSRKLLYGQDFRSIDDVDIPFAPFPATLYVSNRSGAETRTRVDLVGAPLESIVYELLEQKDTRGALGLATWSLQRDFSDDTGLEAYIAAVHAANKEHDAAVFLSKRLNARPVRYAVHQAYLQLLVGPGDRERGLAIYRDLHEKEPREPAWSYLMACLSPKISERLPLLREALAGDAPPDVWHELACTQASQAEWQAALESAQSALEPEDSDGRALDMRLDALAALGRDEQLEGELHDLLESCPADFDCAKRLLERLPTGTSDAELVRRLSELQQRARTLGVQVRPESVVELHAWCAFVLGDLETLRKLDKSRRDGSLRWMLPSLLAEQGRLPEVQPYLAGNLRCRIEPYDALAIALACRAGGDLGQAQSWEKCALQSMRSGIDLDAAQLLGGSRKNVADAALDLALPPWRKAVVLALLSFGDESQRVRLLEEAQRLQTRPIFPRRIVAELASKSVPR